MNKSLNELRDRAFAYAKKQGFHERPMNLGERLMLVVSELSEAMEADRAGKWAPDLPKPTKLLRGTSYLLFS
jgi:hypothetical protein